MATGDASVMVGSPAEIVLADALERGVVTRDEAAPAWDVLRAAALGSDEPAAGRGGRNGMPAYDANDGWLPPPYRGTVSNTLEINAADLALSRIAAALGHEADAARLVERSHGWRALFDADSGFLRSRNGDDGAFVIPAHEFYPEQFSNDYVEANAWQSMFPIDDIAGVRSVYGDPIARLADLLDRSRADWDTRDPASDTAGLLPLPFHWQGNEPSLHVSGLPYELGDDALGKRYVSWVMKTQYSTKPNGIPGNDDGGATSSWWALAAMGLFPIAGSDAWVTGAPLFDETEINVDGHTLTIVKDRVASGAARSIDARPIDDVRVSHAELIDALLLALDP
jgi:putative alpha-1,2-mannosidase